MKILTVNIAVSNKPQFIDDNIEILKSIELIEKVNLNITEFEEAKYLAFKKLLDNTESKYAVFYDEENILDVKLIKYLVNILEGCNDQVLVQELSEIENATKDRYPTGGMLKHNLYFNRYVFKTDVLKNITVSEKEYPYFEEKILLVSMREIEEICLLKGIKLMTTMPLEKDVNSYAKQYDSEWYIPFFERFLLPYMESHQLTASEQRMILYFIMIRFYLNLGSRDKQVLQGDEVGYFFSLLNKAVRKLEDQYIIEVKNRGMLPKFFPYLVLKAKYEDVPFTISKDGKDLVYKMNGLGYERNCVTSRIQAINYESEKLIVDAQIIADYCLKDVEGSFAVQLNGKNVKYIKTERYNIGKAFGKSIYRYYPFQFEIPVTEFKNKNDIQFKILVNKKWIKIPIEFDKLASRLTRSRWSYYKFADKVLTFSNEKLYVSKASAMNTLICELGGMLKTVRTESDKKMALKLVGLRIIYWLTKRQYSGKTIWIFYDKIYKAGDNAEYLFRYCMEHHPEAECYYILNKDANEYKRLKSDYGKHIVVFESLKNKLAVLNAECIFATHASVFGFCGFDKNHREHLKNLLTADVVCIQHGLTIQNIAQYQNRVVDNTKKYFCASKYEIDNLRRPVYGYHDDQLCLTGIPRFDGLINQDKKQVLIAPTWRRNIVITGNKMGTVKEYNPDFKYTQYFKIYNSLINDKRIIETAKLYGYKLIFLIHPTLSSQIEDYDVNEYVSIIPAVSDVSYEKMLTESSLMITDYSGIQFDFAYMKKPVLYYQPKELPPQYTEGVYQYETMAFGPIIDEYEGIVEALCDSIKSGCIMKEKYVKRVDDFFAYTDHSNCKRIMDEIIKWREK